MPKYLDTFIMRCLYNFAVKQRRFEGTYEDYYKKYHDPLQLLLLHNELNQPNPSKVKAIRILRQMVETHPWEKLQIPPNFLWEIHEASYETKKAHCATTEFGIEEAKQIINVLGTEYKNMKKNIDGWITWEGGNRPVSPETVVNIILRDGFSSRRAIAAGNCVWHHYDTANDIVFYRIVL